MVAGRKLVRARSAMTPALTRCRGLTPDRRLIRTRHPTRGSRLRPGYWPGRKYRWDRESAVFWLGWAGLGRAGPGGPEAEPEAEPGLVGATGLVRTRGGPRASLARGRARPRGGTMVLEAGAWSVECKHGPGDGERGPGRVLARVGSGHAGPGPLSGSHRRVGRSKPRRAGRRISATSRTSWPGPTAG